jgi:hypothetical protein
MAQGRKRAPGAGRPPGELGRKSAVFSLRLPPDMRVALVAAAKKNERSFSEELVLRLNRTLTHERGETERPPHVRALAETVARIALGLEHETERAWIDDRYTAQHLAKGIDLFIYSYSRGEAVVPPAVTAAAEARPPEARSGYAAELGETVAGGIISLLKITPAPPTQAWPARDGIGKPIYYPESWWAPWQLEQDLKPKQSRKR